MKVEIITIGDEILIGQIVDTNSAWMAQQLNDIGVEVVQISSISDQKSHIINGLNEAKKRADIILTTGGLGPTSDDITIETLTEFLNKPLALNQQALDNIHQILSRRNIPIGPNNEKQAWLPEGSETIQNSKGTAPGMWYNDGKHILVSMPGVPYEMKAMMQSFVIPKLKSEYILAAILHHTFTVVNIPESVLSTRLIEFEKQLPLNVKLAYLPHLNTVRLRLTCHAKTSEQAQELLNIQADILRQIVHDDLASEGNENPTEQLAADLLSHRLTIATAESCTGGYLAHKLTSVPGSSSYFEGSIISYSYGVKEKLLGVASETMEKKGAVSEEVVRQMAASLKHQLNTDYAIAISGIAGPGGATPSKPVGTVWICIMNNEQTVTRLFHFSGDRHQIVERTTNMAIEMTRRMIGGKPLPDSF
jgi:nicotinamide-nucleotide amidase